jgi:hypothetical protein
MINVVNIKDAKGPYVYIGRYNSYKMLKGSLLANPFFMSNEKDRRVVIDKYRVWLQRHIELKTEVYDYLLYLKHLSELDDLNLGCWCSPKECHGDVIKEVLETL